MGGMRYLKVIISVKENGMMTNYEFRTRSASTPSVSRRSQAAKVSPEKETAPEKPVEKDNYGGLKSLAEAVILQSMEDLWHKTHKKGSIDFFTGEGFGLCADLADMKIVDRLRLLKILRRLNSKVFKTKHSKRVRQLTIA